MYLQILVKQLGPRRFEARDNRSGIVIEAVTEYDALRQYADAARKSHVIDSPDLTPLLSVDRLELVWPTDYEVFTQKFLKNPDWAAYRDFDPPGHEGVDIRCPTGAEVRACTWGTITQVGWRSPNHAYGYAIRQRCKRDLLYELIYAHGQEGSAKVKVGDEVGPGTLLMLGDNTGNSSAPHLHLSVKLPLVNGRPQTPTPGVRSSRLRNGEIMLDPEPFFISGPGVST